MPDPLNEISPEPVLAEDDEVVLYWDDSFAIARALRLAHPGIPIEEVSLGMIYRWTVALPEFRDDRELANESILSAIYQEWLEEVDSL